MGMPNARTTTEPITLQLSASHTGRQAPVCNRYPDYHWTYRDKQDQETPSLNGFQAALLNSSFLVPRLSGGQACSLFHPPFGELFIEERDSWNTPYKFSGKELDEETGYSYFGARYYDPDISIWLSVDPLCDKYPGHSPYSYTLNNPIRFIDPDGTMVDEYELNIGTGEMKNVSLSDNDIVYAVTTNDNGTTTRTGDRIEFDGKPITNAKTYGTSEEGRPEQMVSVSNNEDANKLFDFIIEQTGENQEWSITDYQRDGNSPQSLLTTSGLRGKDPRGGSFVRQLANTVGASILRADHNHPPEPTSEWSSDGDREMRDVVLKNNPNASVNIHFKSGSKWTHRSINNDTKHHHRGEFN